MRIIVKGIENLPAKDDTRRYTFVSNHPLGGIDGIAIGSVIGEHYNDNFRYLVNDLLMNLPGLAPLCIPINKTGKNGRDFPAMVEAGFHGNAHILMFPAGLCSRRKNGVIRDINIMGDYFLTGDIDNRVIRPLRGQPLTREAIAAALPDRLDDIVLNLQKDDFVKLLTSD